MDEMGEKNRIPEIIQETSSSHRPFVSPLFEENQGIHLAFTKVGTTFTPMRAAAWVCPRPFEPCGASRVRCCACSSAADACSGNGWQIYGYEWLVIVWRIYFF